MLNETQPIKIELHGWVKHSIENAAPEDKLSRPQVIELHDWIAYSSKPKIFPKRKRLAMKLKKRGNLFRFSHVKEIYSDIGKFSTSPIDEAERNKLWKG